MVKEIDMQVQEAQRFPNKMDAKRPTPRHIIIKMQKVKGRIFFFFFGFKTKTLFSLKTKNLFSF